MKVTKKNKTTGLNGSDIKELDLKEERSNSTSETQSIDEIDIYQHLKVLLEERDTANSKEIKKSLSVDNRQNINVINEVDDSTDDSLDTNILDIISKDNDLALSSQVEDDDEDTQELVQSIDENNLLYENNSIDVFINEDQGDKKSEIYSECSRLALERKWDELSVYTENVTQTAKGQDLYFARLWWIIAQIETNSMPFGILAGPLDTVSKEVIERKNELSKDLISLTEGTLIKVAKRLFDTDTDIANLFYERAINLNPKYTSEYIDILKKELDDLSLAPQTKVNIEKISFLKSKIATLCDSSKVYTHKNEEKIVEYSNTNLSFGKIPTYNSNNHSDRNNAKISFLMIILLLGGFLFFICRIYPDYLFDYLGINKLISIFSHSDKKDVIVYSELYLPVDFSNDELILPEIIPINVPHNDSLGGMLRELNYVNGTSSQLEKVDKVEKRKTVESHNDDLNEIILAELIKKQKMIDEGSLLKDSNNVKSNSVNTHYPVEPRELEVLINKLEDGEISIEESTTKRVNSNEDFDRVSKPIVAGHSSSDPIVPAYMIPHNNTKDTVLYEINGYAEVFSEPSRRASKVATLISGDRIKVDSFKGDWVKIVSQSGRPGYIQKSVLGRKLLDINDSFRQ